MAEDEIAVTVLASIIGRTEVRPGRRSMPAALPVKDRSTAALAEDLGYGIVSTSTAGLGRLIVGGVHQEHGEIEGVAPQPFARLPIGTRCASCRTMSA